ncbi:MAG: sodium-dependent transporter [Methanobacteriaceae archaeon]|nr:sodium-dependent transporter [Methanobacteriaceae archaeon]
MVEENRSQWNSRFGFMMAMIGSAVGLGNIWRFPNVLYFNGGGSFLIPYVVALFLLGISFVMVEYALGYRFKSSISKILYSIHQKLEPIGWVILLIIFLILSYYICVIGWDLIYFVLSFTKAWGADPNTFFAVNLLQASDGIEGITTFVPTVLIAVIIVWLVIFTITQSNLNKGIELVSKVLIPLLCLMVVGIVIFSLTLPGASLGLTQLFTPDWNQLLNFNVWLSAFGQIVFSLSLGMAIAVTYSSYLPDGSKLVDSALTVAFSNSAFEVFNSVGVFAILGFMSLATAVPITGIITEGSYMGLAFIVFPQVFNVMGPLSYVIGPLFFGCILFAGITSAIALVEPISLNLTEKFNIPRNKAAGLVCGLGLIVSLLFTTQAGLFILTAFDLFLNNFALLLTIVIECIIFGWVYNFDNLIETMNEFSTIKVGKTWKFVIRYALPICILVFWISGINTLIFDAKPVSQIIMVILAIVIVGGSIILSILPAKNDNYYTVLDSIKNE